jgi:hypothetical protein
MPLPTFFFNSLVPSLSFYVGLYACVFLCPVFYVYLYLCADIFFINYVVFSSCLFVSLYLSRFLCCGLVLYLHLCTLISFYFVQYSCICTYTHIGWRKKVPVLKE